MKAKSLKKLIAATAMAAVCCTLHMPVTAGAGTGDMAKAAPTCPPHYMEKRNEQYDVSTENHDYVFAYVDNGDGTTSIIWDTCTVTTTYHQYDLACLYCNMALPQQGPGKIVVHSKRCDQSR